MIPSTQGCQSLSSLKQGQAASRTGPKQEVLILPGCGDQAEDVILNGFVNENVPDLKLKFEEFQAIYDLFDLGDGMFSA